MLPKYENLLYNVPVSLPIEDDRECENNTMLPKYESCKIENAK